MEQIKRRSKKGRGTEKREREGEREEEGKRERERERTRKKALLSSRRSCIESKWREGESRVGAKHVRTRTLSLSCSFLSLSCQFD